MLKLYKKLAHRIPRIWQISPGSVTSREQDRLWPLFKEKGFIGIGWLHDSHSYLEFDSIDKIKKALVAI